MDDIAKEILIRGIKIIDIGYITFIYFIAAFIIASGLNRLYGPFDQEKENTKSRFRIILELVGMVWLNGILIYIVRNLVPYVPFPLDSYYGFEHGKVKELGTAAIFIYFLVFFQKHLQEKARNLYNIYNA